jgi:4-hydroxy-tetrahydrodipicolinate reductase
MTMRVLLIGDGKMGHALRHLAMERGDIVVGLYGPAEMATPITPGIADVAIEFTHPAAAASSVRAALDAGLPVVSGTTGWEGECRALQEQVRTTGGTFLHAANFSLGVHLFHRLVATAAQLAQGSDFHAHLVETHHAAKQDAPSGTALTLMAAAQAATGEPLAVTSVRVGHVPGTHTLVLDAPFEQITLTHEARDRRVFAAGALAVADWLRHERGVRTLDDYLTARMGTA